MPEPPGDMGGGRFQEIIRHPLFIGAVAGGAALYYFWRKKQLSAANNTASSFGGPTAGNGVIEPIIINQPPGKTGPPGPPGKPGKPGPPGKLPVPPKKPPPKKRVPVPTPARPPNHTVYIVQPGDNLTKIAEKFYHNGNLWTKIYAANKGVIGSDPNFIKPGEKLVIP